MQQTILVLLMKKVFLLIFTALCALKLSAQAPEQAPKIYNPTADAKADIASAVKKAQNEGKNVLIQVGGNWCPWCIRVHKFMDDDAEIKSYVAANYVFILVNYSKENKNEEVLKSLGNPGRFGFPVFVVLNSKGETIHIQDSSFLEDGKSYSKNKIMGFLKQWTVQAVGSK